MESGEERQQWLTALESSIHPSAREGSDGEEEEEEEEDEEEEEEEEENECER